MFKIGDYVTTTKDSDIIGVVVRTHEHNDITRQLLTIRWTSNRLYFQQGDTYHTWLDRAADYITPTKAQILLYLHPKLKRD